MAQAKAANDAGKKGGLTPSQMTAIRDRTDRPRSRRKGSPDNVPKCRFCGVDLDKHTSSINFEDIVGRAISLEEARQHTNYHITKVFRYQHDKDRIYAANFWDGESYGFAGESLFCSKTCGHNFARVVAKDLPEVVVQVKVKG